MMEKYRNASMSQTSIPEPVDDRIRDVRNELSHAAGQIYEFIAKVDPERDIGCVLYSSARPEHVGLEYNWTEYFAWYLTLFQNRDEDLLSRFSAAGLLKSCKRGETDCGQDFRYLSQELEFWMSIKVFLRRDENQKVFAYLFVRRSDEDQLFKSILNKYVYNSCDYFIYLDVKNNSYIMFSGSTSGTPLPPTECLDYSSEIVKYAENFVVPEDRDMVIREMQLSRVLEVLEKKETHAFYCGIIEPDREYTRKRLEYRYYDKERQMVLLSRVDVTEDYLEEKSHQHMLQDALTRAQTDSLTGLLNYRGTVEHIENLLAAEGNRFAMLFIDLDNFKDVNDTLGHMAGDELLKYLSNILLANIRATDLAGRVGGDEFVIFLQDVETKEEVEACAERLCKAVREMDDRKWEGVSVSCSIGVAFAPEDGRTYQTLLKKADQMVYRAKAEGKDGYSI